MFDLRYHVASLAAVFVALIVGILVGVGLSGSGVTNETALQVAQAQRADAERDRDAALAQVSQLKETGKAFELAYPALMNNLLAGKRIGVLFVGSADSGINNAIDRTLTGRRRRAGDADDLALRAGERAERQQRSLQQRARSS